MFRESKAQFEKVALVHLPSVFRAAVAMCGQTPLAEDLTQTTFVKAMQAFGSFKAGTNCRAWLLRILRNAWTDWLRHKKIVGPEVDVDDVPLAAEPEAPATTWSDADDLLENFSDAQVISALAQLPEAQRLTLYLVEVEQMPLAEVAEITGVPIGTVKSRSSHARAALREKLEAHARELGFGGHEK